MPTAIREPRWKRACRRGGHLKQGREPVKLEEWLSGNGTRNDGDRQLAREASDPRDDEDGLRRMQLLLVFFFFRFGPVNA